jgi:AcrR family transcriptional regulator
MTERTNAIIDGFMGLVAERPYHAVTLAEVAARAGVSLAELRREFDGRTAILAAFSRRIDAQVLSGIDANMADEPARERLFDVLMRRFDALAPYKEAMRSLDAAVRDNPALGLDWLPIAIRAQRWSLAAADAEAGGMRGEIAARGLVLAFARTLRVWLDDDDPGLARTMSELDRQLRSAERNMRRLDGLARFAKPFCGIARRVACLPRRRRREPSPVRTDEDGRAATA